MVADHMQRTAPFAKTKFVQFLQKKLDQLPGDLTQSDIARKLGYDKPNIISMFKTGSSKVPLDKIPQLAEAIGADPAHLLRLGLEQYWPDKMGVITEVFSGLATKNERDLLRIFRRVTHETDPRLLTEQKERIEEALEKILKH